MSDSLTRPVTALFDGRVTVEAETIVRILCSLAANKSVFIRVHPW